MLYQFYNKLRILSSNNKRKGVLFFVLCFFGDSIFAWSYVLNKISICFFFTTEYCILCGISFTPVQQKCQYRHKNTQWTNNEPTKSTSWKNIPRVNISTHKNAFFYIHDDQTTAIIIIIAIIQQQQQQQQHQQHQQHQSSSIIINHHQSSSSFWSSWKCIVWVP